MERSEQRLGKNVFNFGKHRGMTFAQVYQDDNSYLRWITRRLDFDPPAFRNDVQLYLNIREARQRPTQTQTAARAPTTPQTPDTETAQTAQRLRKQIKDLQQQNNNVKNKLCDLQAQYKVLQKDYSTGKMKIIQYENLIQKYEAQINSFQKRQKEFKIEMQEGLRQRINYCLKTNMVLHDITSKFGHVPQAESRHKSFEEGSDQTAELTERIHTEVTSLIQECNQKQTKLDQLREELLGGEERKTKTQKYIQDIKAQLDRLRQRLQSEQEKRIEVQQNNKKNKIHVKELKDENLRLVSERRSQEQRIRQVVKTSALILFLSVLGVLRFFKLNRKLR